VRRRLGRGLREAGRLRVPLLLRRANRAFAAGDFAAAANDFEELALAAEARGGSRAPIFHIQVGRAKVMAGDLQAGMAALTHGLGLLEAQGRKLRLRHLGTRLRVELQGLGHDTEAEELGLYLERATSGAGDSEEPLPSSPALLPTHCPGCGAPLRVDEIEWLDPQTAECAYCGSPVRAAH
jgi:hypothetical protein